MKTIASYILAAMAATAFISCDDSHKPDWSETEPFNLSVSSVSISDGATVSASTGTIEVVYSENIAINSLVNITLNSTDISSVVVEDGNKLVATVSLQPATDYVFNIPSRAVAGVGSKTFAPEVTINFRTDGTAPAPADKVIDKSLLTTTLTNAAASDKAKAVYQLLVDNYGNHQLSGAMGQVAWATEFCDYIFDSTGKYPAIVGFDYIHLASSPANWIDYGDITPVKNAWEAGSIPAMTWHWNVPKSEDDPSLGYDAKSDAFSAANVLVEGTWENRVATADVEKLAGYLKLLKDAGIPVLWRPFHEAAGDYTWGSWFWWGNSGVETTKELWKWLRNKLENEYGLDNLIWVWTVQTSDEGKPADLSKIKAAYPGDELVDIVGADLYLEPLSNSVENFRLLYDLTGGKKIVALSECGNLLDVESAFSQGALWSYFMGWYDLKDGAYGFHEWNTAGEWKTVLDNPLVLNRGDFRF